MKLKRFLCLALVAVLALVLVACGGGKKKNDEDLLKSYLLNLGTVIENDFTVDATLKVGEETYDLKWASNNECLKVADTAVDGSYTVTVTRPDAKTDVTLTVTLGKATKDFTFQVNPYSVYDFTKAFVFANDKAIVSADFELPTTFEKWGKTATITWESLNTDLIKISEDGKTALVTASSAKTNVQLKAKFAYAGEESVLRFSVTVFEAMDNMETINYWYTNTGVSQTLSGYVLGIGTVYNPSYGNVSIYVIDDSFKAGYYIYRGLCDEATAAKIVPGVHVTVTGSTNTVYSGLYETNEKTGTITVDEDIPAIDPLTTITDYDNELISKTPAYIYRQSSLIKLNGWKIVEKLAAPASGNTTNILKIERDGAQITVTASKYVESFFTVWEADADPKFQALVDKYATLNVGDYIDIVGVLSARDGDLLNVIGADYITASADKGEAAGKEVAPVIAKAKFEKKYAEPTTIELVKSEGNVTVTWRLAKDSAVAKVEDGKLVITPGAADAQFTLIGNYAKGDWSTDVYYVIKVGVIDNSIKTVAEAKALEKGAETTIQGTVMAINSKGYILLDNTDAIYVYVAGTTVETEKVFTFKVGDTIKVEGTLDNYKGLVEYIPTKTTKVEISASEADLNYYTTEQIQAYVAETATAYAQDYVQFEGTLKISGNYYNVIIEGLENEQVSISNPTDELKAMIADLDGKKIVFSGYAIGQSSNKYLNVMVSSIDSALTVNGALKANNGTTVTVEGQVVAASSRGYVVYDGTAAVYVYAYGSSNTDLKDVYFYEEDFIRVTGTKGFYNGDQIIPTEADWLEEAPESLYNQGKAEVYDAAKINEYVASTNTTFPTKLVELTGKVAISGSYYNFLVGEGEAVGNGSFSYLTEEQKAEYEDGKTYTVYGYAIGHSSNKYFNFIPCSYTAPLDPYQEVYKEGALYVNPAFTAESCTWGGQALTFGTNGFADVNSAIAAAQAGAEIYLQSGEYTIVNPGDAAITFNKELKFFGPNAEIDGSAKQRYPEATLLFNIDKSNAQTAVIMESNVEFYGVELKGNGIGANSGVMFEAGKGVYGATFKNCLINSINTFLKIQNGSAADYLVESCKIHGINQFFAWITAGTNSFTFVNNTFDGTDCGKVANEKAALFRIRCVCDVKIYHNLFIGDTVEDAVNPGLFENNSFDGTNGTFDIQYNEFNLTEKFFYKNTLNGFTQKATMNNNLYTNGMGNSTDYPATIETADAGVTKDETVFETKEDLEAAWAAAGITWDVVKETYTVTFDSNGGSTVDPIDYTNYATVVLPVPTKEGFVFDGWYVEEVKYEALKENANITLKAKWLTAYTLTYDVDGGVALDPVVFTDYTKVVLATPSREGAAFDGWYVDDVKYEALKENANITLKAKWNLNAYTLTYDVDGGVALDPVVFTDYTTVELATPVKEGYKFLGWYVEEVKYEALTENANITLKAKWQQTTFYVDANDEGKFATVALALEAASDGDTIVLAAGTYAEELTITKAVTIKGPNAGVAGYGTRADEAIFSKALIVKAAVTFDGIKTIDEAHIQIAANNVNILNSFIYSGYIACNGNNRMAQIVDFEVAISDLTIDNCKILSPGEIWEYTTNYISITNVTNLTITNNYITNEAVRAGGTAGEGMMIYNLAGDTKINNNVFEYATDQWLIKLGQFSINGNVEFCDNICKGRDGMPTCTIGFQNLAATAKVKIWGNELYNVVPSTWTSGSSAAGATIDVQWNYYDAQQQYKYSSVGSATITCNNNCYKGVIHASNVAGSPTNDAVTYSSLAELKLAYEKARAAEGQKVVVFEYAPEVVDVVVYTDPATVVFPTEYECEGYVLAGWLDGETLVTALAEAKDVILKAKLHSTLLVVDPATEGCYQTLAAALADALPGDTIQLAAGTYNEMVTLNVKGLTIKGVEGAKLVWNSGSEKITIAADDIVFDGVEIEGYTTGQSDPIFTIGADVNNLTFKNCYIHKMNALFKELSSTKKLTGEFKVENCKLENISQFILGLGDGTDKLAKVTLKDNTIYGNETTLYGTNGWISLRATASTQEVLIEGNTFIAPVSTVNNFFSVLTGKLTITGNTFVGVTNVLVAGKTTDVTITGNIWQDATGMAIAAPTLNDSKVDASPAYYYGTEEKPLTVAQANALLAIICPTSDAISAEQLVVKGIVKENPNDKGSYIQNVYLVDAIGDTSSLLVYSVNETETVVDPLQNDTVVIKGYAKNYKGTLELADVTVGGGKVYPTLVSKTIGNSTVSASSENAAEVTVNLPEVTSVANGSTVEFTVSLAEGKQVVSVKVYNQILTANEGTYSFIMKGNAEVKVEIKNVGEAVPTLTASFSFESLEIGEYHVSEDKKTLDWVQNGITFYVYQETSKTNVANNSGKPYTNPIRIYQNQKVQVDYKGICKIVFHCASGYGDELAASTMPEGAVVTTEGDDVILTFATPVDTLTISAISAATRFNSIDVYTLVV